MVSLSLKYYHLPIRSLRSFSQPSGIYPKKALLVFLKIVETEYQITAMIIRLSGNIISVSTFKSQICEKLKVSGILSDNI
jgi:hypothetical protein